MTKSAISVFNYLGEIKFYITADCEVFADYGLIKKSFFYILENSLKYCMGKGLIKVNAQYDIYTVIEFIDHGIGINEKRIENLFDITKNIAQNNEGPKNGSGLGLFLTQQIVLLNKDSTNLEGKLDVGTKVTSKLPKRNNHSKEINCFADYD